MMPKKMKRTYSVPYVKPIHHLIKEERKEQ